MVKSKPQSTPLHMPLPHPVLCGSLTPTLGGTGIHRRCIHPAMSLSAYRNGHYPWTVAEVEGGTVIEAAGGGKSQSLGMS